MTLLQWLAFCKLIIKTKIAICKQNIYLTYQRETAMSQKRVRACSGCPIDYALDIFGDRWTLLVIRDLVFGGKRHFREFIESPEGIASNILASRLKKLEQRGLISRRGDAENRKQVVYELTDKGIDLIPVLIEIIRWGARHDHNTAAPKVFVERLEADRDALIREIADALKHGKSLIPM
jgi:DNA-binding HxlR family transcriptional regulator